MSVILDEAYYHQALFSFLKQEGFSLAAMRLLDQLGEADTVPTSILAASLGNSQQAVGKLARRLEIAKLVTVNADPRDNRARLIGLTPKGTSQRLMNQRDFLKLEKRFRKRCLT
jgi:DNA-binding MarR family transcriptional regulator